MFKTSSVFLIVALAAVPSYGQYRTGCTPAAATSCTLLASPHFGDVMISYAARSGSTTAPSLATGWVNIESAAGANSLGRRIAFKLSTGSETTCGTWTNATDTACVVYEGGLSGTIDIQDVGSVGGPIGVIGTPAHGGTSSTSLTYPTPGSLTNSRSYVIGFGFANQTIDTAPTGSCGTPVLRTGTTIADLAIWDTNSSVSSCAAQTVTMTAGSWLGDTVELLISQAFSGIGPYLVHNLHFGQSGEACTASGVCTFPIPSTLANNYLQLALAWTYTTTAPTISNIYCNSDTGHSTWTWTATASVAATGDTVATIYYIAGAAAGCTTINIVFSSAPTSFEADYSEFRQVATSSPIDVSTGQYLTTDVPEVTAGSLTPTVNGDLIYEHCTQDAFNTEGFGNVFLYVPGGVTLLDVDLWNIGGEAFIQTTAAALSPYMYVTGNASGYVCMAVALKVSSGAGTAPSAPYLLNQGFYIYNAAVKFQVPLMNTGHSLVFEGQTGTGANQKQWSGLSDLLGNSLTSYQPSDANGGYPNWALECNISVSGQDVLSLTGPPSGNGNYIISEWVGLNTSTGTACYDKTATAAFSSGPYNGAPSLTPSTGAGIIVAAINEGTGPISGITSPSGGIYALPTYAGQSDGSEMTNGGGYAYLFNTSTSAKAWNWTSPNSSNATAGAIALTAAPVIVSCPAGSFLLLGSGC